MKLLLDSCALIWLASDPSRLSITAIAAINDTGNELYASHSSLWEISLKHAAGKLTLPAAPRFWWQEQMTRWGIIDLPLTAEVLFRSTELSPHHKDPFDRALLAQASIDAFQVVSPDEAFPAYGLPILW